MSISSCKHVSNNMEGKTLHFATAYAKQVAYWIDRMSRCLRHDNGGCIQRFAVKYRRDRVWELDCVRTDCVDGCWNDCGDSVQK